MEIVSRGRISFNREDSSFFQSCGPLFTFLQESAEWGRDRNFSSPEVVMMFRKLKASTVEKLSQVPLMIIAHIDFQSLQELYLEDIRVYNVESLSFMNLRNLGVLSLASYPGTSSLDNRMRSLRPLAKCRLLSLQKVSFNNGCIHDTALLSRALQRDELTRLMLERNFLRCEVARVVTGQDLAFLMKLKLRRLSCIHSSNVMAVDDRIHQNLLYEVISRKFMGLDPETFGKFISESVYKWAKIVKDGKRRNRISLNKQNLAFCSEWPNQEQVEKAYCYDKHEMISLHERTDQSEYFQFCSRLKNSEISCVVQAVSFEQQTLSQSTERFADSMTMSILSCIDAFLSTVIKLYPSLPLELKEDLKTLQALLRSYKDDELFLVQNFVRRIQSKLLTQKSGGQPDSQNLILRPSLTLKTEPTECQKKREEESPQFDFRLLSNDKENIPSLINNYPPISLEKIKSQQQHSEAFTNNENFDYMELKTERISGRRSSAMKGAIELCREKYLHDDSVNQMPHNSFLKVQGDRRPRGFQARGQDFPQRKQVSGADSHSGRGQGREKDTPIKDILSLEQNQDKPRRETSNQDEESLVVFRDVYLRDNENSRLGVSEQSLSSSVGSVNKSIGLAPGQGRFESEPFNSSISDDGQEAVALEPNSLEKQAYNRSIEGTKKEANPPIDQQLYLRLQENVQIAGGIIEANENIIHEALKPFLD